MSIDIYFWKNFICSDEIEFEVFEKKKSTKIWMTRNQALAEKNVISTVKFNTYIINFYMS